MIHHHHKYRRTSADKLNDLYDGNSWKTVKLKDNTTSLFINDPAEDN